MRMTMRNVLAVFVALGVGLALFGLYGAAQAQEGKKDVIDTARDVGSLNTFLKAVEAVYLVSVLKAPKSQYTLFAPSDEAFSKLPPGMLEDLFKPENQLKLEKIVKYHIVRQPIKTSEFLDLYTIESMQGEMLYLGHPYKSQPHMVNNARVIKGNIEASNGIIHVISRVLMPK